MKSRLQFFTVIASLALAGNALAQSIDVSTEVIIKGATGSATLGYTAGMAATNLDFILDYDETVVDETALAIDCSTTIPELTALNCSVDTAANQLKGIGVNFSSSALSTTASAAVITLPVLAGAASGDSTQNFVANFFDVSGGGVGTQNGTWTITVTDGPQPDYSSNPAPAAGISLNVVQGGVNPTQDVAISNAGDAGSTLTGSCTESADPDGVFSISGDTPFSVDQGAAADVVTVACDSSGAIGPHSGTMECTHNGSGVTEASPAVYNLLCNILSGPPAVYDSTPADGSTIDMTPPGDDVPAGTPVADQVLTIMNAAPEANADDLTLSNCAFAGSAEITATAPGSLVLAQGASTMVTFSCDSASVGAYTGTYSCDYDVNNDASSDGTASYTVNCGVRAASSDISESPMSGTDVRIAVPINGTGQTSVTFSEILDEGVDATVDSCSLTDGTVFSIVTVTPITVSAGTTEPVTISGTDPGTGTVSFTDTLTCTYTDSDSTPGTASWPLTLTVLPAAIPTLSVWGITLMILTMLGLGGIVIRRKVRS